MIKNHILKVIDIIVSLPWDVGDLEFKKRLSANPFLKIFLSVPLPLIHIF